MAHTSSLPMQASGISTEDSEDDTMLTYGVAALARPTFDVPFAEQMKERAFEALKAAGIRTVGPRALLFDRAAAESAIAEISAAGPIDLLLILQITFTDATMTVKLARESRTPLAIWAVPEPRSGGRLRLNAYCGLNLAAHALGLADVAHGSLYADPSAPGLAESLRALARSHAVPPSAARVVAEPSGGAREQADRVLATLRNSQITVVGKHPDGFDTCEYDAALLARLAGIKVGNVTLPELFDRARATDAARVDRVRAAASAELAGLDQLDAQQLDRSFRVFCALEDLQRDTGARGLAVRCWPEMFTEYGCAACGPMAMMNQKQVPAACEADVNGSITQLMLQELAQEPAWMADLVDITAADDTAVLWHCGLAPLSMRDPQARAEATIHTNRRMPLLHQFPIKPGRITLARLSRARNEVKLVLAGAQVLRAPMPFTGCSGTVRFDRPAAQVSQRILDEALEHHFALAYGEHRPALRAVAARWNVPVLELA
jgi:L-fucose isomerase-like protein